MTEPKENKVTIKIPRALYNNLKSIIQDTGFNSVTDFIVYVLRDLASRGGATGEGGSLTREEIQLIRRRLKNLGYL
ncbi:CopG family transcriptional regulator [candidate division KSB1 bacterium]|nr:CopG family transcriptional regulator [candidate division KSB1 bacterium]